MAKTSDNDRTPASFEALRQHAEQGDAAAQFNLGVCFAARAREHTGSGVAKDRAEAVRWYRKAADQGLAAAQFNLGVCFDAGTGVAKDAAEAVRWYRRAADQGYAAAQFNLGVCFAAGTGVPKDRAEAIRLYRKAADQGYQNAQKELQFTFREQLTGVLKIVFGFLVGSLLVLFGVFVLFMIALTATETAWNRIGGDTGDYAFYFLITFSAIYTIVILTIGVFLFRRKVTGFFYMFIYFGFSGTSALFLLFGLQFILLALANRKILRARKELLGRSSHQTLS
jgi:hypothetical protein